MPRTVDRMDGLCLLGEAELGPTRGDVPALLVPEGTEEGPAIGTIAHRVGAAGRRALVLSRAGHALELETPVLAPEVAGVGTGVHAIGERAYLLHAPFDPAAAAGLRAARPQLVVLGNARALWNEGAPFIEAVRALREAVGAAPLLWAPRVALPHRLPLLAYLGIDLLDATEGLLRAAEGTFFDRALGPRDRASVVRERSCRCPSCTTEPPGSLALHTLHLYRDALSETRSAVREGRLRELTEARLTAEPALAEMLRYADRSLAGALEERAPVVGSESRTYVLAESQRRAEVRRFRERLLSRYRPPPSKSVLLLVPCSKTKPYRLSRSHRRFASALEGLPGLERVQVVSVSSPLGLVPRELEDVYPARHYDIPVTGDWSGPEQTAVLAGLEHLLETGRYRTVIVHLDPEEYGFVQELLAARPPPPSVSWTLENGRTTSAEALARLRAAVDRSLDGLPLVAGGPLAVVREELGELASVQFGRAAAERLFAPPVRLAGRPWFQRLTDGKVDLATVREERGLFHLTVAGARRIGRPYPLAVEVDPSLPLTGDLFVPGVRSADPAIRVGDSVVLLRNGDLAAVGEATLPGPLMTELERGLAVRIRHRERSPTDTALTRESPPTDRGPVVQR